MRRDVDFQSEGRVLRGWLYAPEGEARSRPCIVMAHGLSAVKEQYLCQATRQTGPLTP